MEYTDLHRYLLRSVSSRGILSLPEAQEMIIRFPEGHDADIKDMLSTINEVISPFQQTIKLARDELTEEQVLIFLSLAFDDATKAQNFFSATELEFFRLLIEEIMSTETRQISGIYAMNLVGKMKGSFTKSDAQKLMNTWCRMRYLDRSNNEYALGVRAIHEFESYLRQNMPDTIEECSLCKQIVFRGCNCPGCGLAVHTLCLNRYLEKVEKWPCCKIDYDAAQLNSNNTESDSSRLEATQPIEESRSTVYDTTVELTQESTEDIDLTQATAPGISQSVTRKRKRVPT